MTVTDLGDAGGQALLCIGCKCFLNLQRMQLAFQGGDALLGLVGFCHGRAESVLKAQHHALQGIQF